MKRKILNNISLKVLSAVCAVLLWAVIINIYDPAISVTISGVSVELINEHVLTDKELTYEVVDGSRISVYVTGPRSKISNIQATDIVATADLSKSTSLSDYVEIDVSLSKEGMSSTGIEIIPKTTAVKLNIENRISKTFEIDIDITGTPAQGYVVDYSSIMPNEVRLTGASSIIETVDKIKAVYDISGSSENINDTTALRLYDTKGNVVSPEKIEFSRNSVGIDIIIYPLKTVPLKVTTTGTLGANYRLDSTEINISEIVIYGEAEKLSAVESIEIPVNISELRESQTFEVNIGEYLPESIKHRGAQTAIVTVNITALVERELNIPIEKISFRNIPAGLRVDWGEQKTVSIIIIGDEFTVNRVISQVADWISGAADLSGFNQGTHIVRMQVEGLPLGCTVKLPCQIEVNLTEEQTSPEI